MYCSVQLALKSVLINHHYRCAVRCVCAKKKQKTQHIMWNGTSPRLADAGRLLSLFHLVVDDVFTSVSVLFQPVGMYLHKYEWSGSHEAGDCSLLIRVAQLEFDDGFWECQVTASDFTTQDALTSQPVRLVVRGKFQFCILVYSCKLRSVPQCHQRNIKQFIHE